MSDQSGNEDDLPSDVAEIPTEQDSGESETDQGDGFFDLEADESDGHDESEDNEDDEDEYDHSNDGRHFSFPQFSRLPPELRAMIWEAVDPHLKSQGRVLDFYVIEADLWESATLSQQTAPARALLAATKESRCIALQHHPDAIQLRGGRGEVRFDSSNDIILLHCSHQIEDVRIIGRWCDKIKYLAFSHDRIVQSDPIEFFSALDSLPQVCRNLKAVFCSFDGCLLGDRKLEWSVSECPNQFYIEASEGFKALYCWPDTERANFFDGYAQQLPDMPTISSRIPLLAMAQYTFNTGLALYHRVKRRYERSIRREAGSASPLESSDGESFYESESDDYALDGFVVDSSSEGSEESSNHEDLSDEDRDEDNARFDQDPDVFNGFSPLQEELSDNEATKNLPNATIVGYDLESGETHLSDAASSEEQPRIIAQTSRRKRHIVSSDDAGNDEDGDEESTVKTHSRVKKRARVVLSDSEDDEDGSRNSARSQEEGSSRLQRRAPAVLSDSEDEEDERNNHNEGHRPLGYKPDEDEDEDDEDEDDDESEEGRPASGPVSLLARLRQFRSDVPVSPEGESSNSAEEYDEEEQYEDDEKRRLSDAEFPESAAEDGEEDEW
ncbi:hypothetical protein F4823DRAFT_580147 [Ustulina deusta]|nr:hypothetical protein F4823DRAFT_580147 [Ustulina deusta]